MCWASQHWQCARSTQHPIASANSLGCGFITLIHCIQFNKNKNHTPSTSSLCGLGTSQECKKKTANCYIILKSIQNWILGIFYAFGKESKHKNNYNSWEVKAILVSVFNPSDQKIRIRAGSENKTCQLSFGTKHKQTYLEYHFPGTMGVPKEPPLFLVFAGSRQETHGDDLLHQRGIVTGNL